MQINLNKQLTQNFKLSEFLESKFYNPEQQKKVLKSVNHRILENIQELADNLQVLRDYLGVQIDVHIAFRSVWWELQQNRSGKSQHTKGKAADISSPYKTHKQIYDAIEHLIKIGDMKQGGLSLYSWGVHYDTFFDGINVRRW